MSKQDQRDKIHAGANLAFAKFGYAKTSMVDIARLAGISRASLYQYFSNKEDLYREFVLIPHQQSLDLTDELLKNDTLSFEEKLHKVIDSRIGFMSRLLQETPHASEMERIAKQLSGDILADYSQQYLKRVASLLKRANSDGLINLKASGLTAKNAAGILVFGADGQRNAIGPNFTESQFEDRMHRFVDLFLTAVAPKGGKK